MAQTFFFAHAGLGVSVKVYDLMMKFTRNTLKAMKVDKELTKLIIDDFEVMREPICDPTGKLGKVHEAARKALDAELGDPFDTKANQQRYEENQRKEKERRDKMAAFRKQRRLDQEAKKQKEAKALKEQKSVVSTPKADSKEAPPRQKLSKFRDTTEEVKYAEGFTLGALDDESMGELVPGPERRPSVVMGLLVSSIPPEGLCTFSSSKSLFGRIVSI